MMRQRHNSVMINDDNSTQHYLELGSKVDQVPFEKAIGELRGSKFTIGEELGEGMNHLDLMWRACDDDKSKEVEVSWRSWAEDKVQSAQRWWHR